MCDITDDLHAALRPFVVYAPEECFEGSKRYYLIETTEAGGGWFGTEDFRRAREALAIAEMSVDRPNEAYPHGDPMDAHLHGLVAAYIAAVNHRPVDTDAAWKAHDDEKNKAFERLCKYLGL